MTDKEKIENILTHLNISAKDLSSILGMSRPDALYHIIKGRNGISNKLADTLLFKLPWLSKTWLLAGDGDMVTENDNPFQEYKKNIKPIWRDGLTTEQVIEMGKRKINQNILHESPVYYGGQDPEEPHGKLIPLYDDVASIGGNNEMVANTDGISEPAEYIDTGDWFREATAAIRHYGESMVEYPTGCILALKEVLDRELIIPGRDYSIETSEYRVTKRVQRGKTDEYLRAYSTNPETYPDGQLVHEPFDIPWRAVNRISLVLGYVVKKNGGTMVFSSKKK